MTCRFFDEFWPEYESAVELYFMALKIDEKFEEKLTRGLENDRGSLVNFHQGTRKSQSWDFNEILLYKKENVWA